MKRNALLIIIALVALTCCAPASFAQKKDKEKLTKEKDVELGEQMERTIPASQNVVVTLCMASGDVQVHGWDRSEIKVVATSVSQLELQGGGANPAQRVEVVISNSPKASPNQPLVCDCRGVSDLEINVPRGATIEIKTRSGQIEVSQVAEARVDNTSGDITLSNVTRAVEANTISGDVSLSDSSGRIRLRSISGDVEANNIHPVGTSDDFTAHSTSGDISLDDVSQARLTANTTSGMVTMTGRLAQRGSYELNSFSGDVVLNIPPDSSFRLNARSQQGSINTDFPIKSVSEEDSQNPPGGSRLTGTVGTGDASITVSTFNGTVRLQKR